MRKILFNNPWLLPISAFLAFIGICVAFIFFAVKHKPVEIKRATMSQHP
jgi:hypothetical protein